MDRPVKVPRGRGGRKRRASSHPPRTEAMGRDLYAPARWSRDGTGKAAARRAASVVLPQNRGGFLGRPPYPRDARDAFSAPSQQHAGSRMAPRVRDAMRKRDRMSR
ncbi:Hypothetical protein A7982_11820 [Minicystis rosea]|nr:Hypothetical protein A7982_11820 [Minicystis rosea]